MSCISPIQLDGNEFACGQCKPCLKRKAREWAFRLEQESKDARSGYFLTLTYSDENAIWVDTEYGTFTTLYKRDLQLFMKRLRKYDSKIKSDSKKKVRFFACGEYGEKTKRAHYHVMVFNLKRETVENLDQIWKKGTVHKGDVNVKTIRYITNYMLTKNIDVIKPQQKPFLTMSRRKGIGQRYLSNQSEYHKRTKDYKGRLPGKVKVNLPAYYQAKIFKGKEAEEIKKAKIEEFRKFVEEKRKKAIERNPLNPFEYEESEKQIIKEKFERKTRKL